jgi:hypothetical protein
MSAVALLREPETIGAYFDALRSQILVIILAVKFRGL